MRLEGFSSDIVEKMDRLCDLLSAIGKSRFLSERLSLYGGTALNFIYLDHPRLSEDLDFNYRHIDSDDWGTVRDRIDGSLKFIIDSLGYKEDALKINSHYNLCRFHLNYTSETGINDDIKIEIGYMRRFPNLKEDRFERFSHFITEEKIDVKTPIKEELFANKFAAMISRSKTYLNPRDIFDVYSISKEEFDRGLFSDLVALEAMLMDLSKSSFVQIKERLLKGRPSGKIEHLISTKFTLQEIIIDVLDFTKEIIGNLSPYDIDDIMDQFYATGRLDLESFKFKDQLNPLVQEHPLLQWLRKAKV